MLGLSAGVTRRGSSGAGAPADSTAPTITSANTNSVAENATLSHALTANETVTWSIVAGGDGAKFEISGSTLRWASNGTKDYEAPDDANTDNAYVVTVRATDTASNTTDQTITVTVTDVADSIVVAGYTWALPSGQTRLFYDDFIGTNATDLNLHTSDSGGTWARNSAVSTVVGLITSSPGRFYPNTGNQTVYVASTVPTGADQTVFWGLDYLSNPGNQDISAILRASDTAVDGYSFGYSTTLGLWRIGRILAGTVTTVGTTTAEALTLNQVYSIKGEATGTTLNLYVNGVLKATATHSGFASAGRFAIRNVGSIGGAAIGRGHTEVHFFST